MAFLASGAAPHIPQYSTAQRFQPGLCCIRKEKVLLCPASDNEHAGIPAVAGKDPFCHLITRTDRGGDLLANGQGAKQNSQQKQNENHAVVAKKRMVQQRCQRHILRHS